MGIDGRCAPTDASSRSDSGSAEPGPAQPVHQDLKDGEDLLPRRVEGAREARGILLDYLDCVLHVFTPEAPDYDRLEDLWGQAPSRTVA